MERYLYHGRHRRDKRLGWITRTVTGLALLFAVLR